MTMQESLVQKQRAYRAKELLGELLDGWERQQKDCHKLSVGRAILAAAQGRYRQGAEAEFEAWGCVDQNPQRIVIPITHLFAAAMHGQRDLSTAAAGDGAYLTATGVPGLALPLVGSGVAQAGANIISNVVPDQAIPKISVKPTFEWQSSPTDALTTDTAMTLSQTSATLKRGGIDLKVSRQLTLQAKDFDRTIERLIIQLANDAIDLAALNGSGSNGEPQGLLQNGSVTAVSGASMNVSGLSQMEEGAVANDASDDNLTWFASTDTRRILRQRELTAGGGSIWPGKDLLGHRAIVTSKMPSASLLVGDFTNLSVLLFGPGVEVLVNPFANFQSGQITFQVSVAVDIAVNYPGSFRKSTSIS